MSEAVPADRNSGEAQKIADEIAAYFDELAEWRSNSRWRRAVEMVSRADLERYTEMKRAARLVRRWAATRDLSGGVS